VPDSSTNASTAIALSIVMDVPHFLQFALGFFAS